MPVEDVFGKETGNFGDRDHDAFWAEYFTAPELTLPPGRYRIEVRRSFRVDDCEGDDIGLWVYSAINVIE